jgi:hypothetical protein
MWGNLFTRECVQYTLEIRLRTRLTIHCTAYTDLRFHLFKVTVLINDSFTELSEIDKFVFLINEGRLQYVLYPYLIGIRRCFYVSTCFKHLDSGKYMYVYLNLFFLFTGKFILCN